MSEAVFDAGRESVTGVQLTDVDEPPHTEELRNERSERERMAERVRNRITNPWVYIPTSVVVWLLLWVSIDALLGDGGVISAAIPGAAGGLAFGVCTYYFKYRDSI